MTLPFLDADDIIPDVAANLTRAPAAFSIDMTALAAEGGDPSFGTVTWRTLISADRRPSAGLVAGVAEFGPGGTLLPHRHNPAEMYFGLSGEGTVTVDGVAHRIAAGVAVFLPGEVEHGVVAGENGLTFLYAFPADRFDAVDYRFSAASPLAN